MTKPAGGSSTSKKRTPTAKPRTVAVDDRGLLTSLHTAALEGSVSDVATPARIAPVVVDERSELVHIVHVAEGRAEIERSGWSLENASSITLLPTWLPARLGFTFVVVGVREIASVGELSKPIRSNNTPLQQFLAFLQSTTVVDPDLGAERLSSTLAVWLCTPEDASELELRVARSARTAIVDAWRHPDGVGLADAAWWLARASAGERDDIDAAAAIRHAGDDPMADALLRAVGLRPFDVAAPMREAEARWQTLAAERVPIVAQRDRLFAGRDAKPMYAFQSAPTPTGPN